MIQERVAPANVALIGEELAIAWSDGKESYLKLDALRKHCPCARCGGEPDLLSPSPRRAPAPENPAAYRLRSWRVVGGYAFQPTWEDGHDTGLFTYRFLRELSHA
ncbi:MAG: DUF971 domain-containing protein [Verrucomicrobium sp.]|nr:DUF971 domain-containing protein [Verrucomicrobium sp.]